MPVSTIEIENFKSYGGKHIIGPFSDHLTSIIGPNGCGKSNLMDAISFVFGLHAQSLRSQQLRDLIYRNSNDNSMISNTKQRKLKCTVTLVYSNDMNNNNENNDNDSTATSGEVIRFTRSILPSGVGEYSVNGIVKSRNEYEAALEEIGVYVQARNFLVFQGDVENLARKNPIEMMTLLETISGSIEYKQEYDTAYQLKDEMEQQQKSIVQQKKVHEYERQQYKTQKLEADQFHNLLQERNTTQTDYYLWQLYHINQDKIEKEASAATIANDVQASTDVEHKVGQELKDAKKAAALARRNTATCEKQRVAQAALCDQYEPNRIQITEEISNLQTKLEQDKKQLQKKILEEQTHDSKLESLNQEIQEYKETEQDLNKEYEEEKVKLLASVSSSDNIVQLTKEQEDEYAVIRELANQASAEPRRVLQQCQRQFDTSRNLLSTTKEEFEQAVKSQEQIKRDVTNLTERCSVMTTSVATNQTTVKETEKELIELQARYQQTQKRCEELDIEIENLDVQLRDVKNQKRQTKEEERFIQAIQTLQSNYTGVYGRLQDLCSPTQRKYATAVTVAAGKDMDAIVVSNNEIGFECIKYLREQKIGVATFLPLENLQVPTMESMEHMRTQISKDDRYRLAIDVIQCSDDTIKRAVLYAVGNTVVCDDLDSARELCFGKNSSQQHRSSSRHQSQTSSSDTQLRMKAVTLAGAVISKAGTMTGGTSKDDNDQGRWKNQDIDKIRQKKEELEAERAQLDIVGGPQEGSGQRQHQAGGTGYMSQIEFLRNKLSNLKNREHYSKSELEYTKKTLKEKEVLLQATNKQISRLKKKLNEIEKEYEKCNAAVKEAIQSVKAAEDVHLAPFRAATGLRDLKAYESAMGQFREEYQKKKKAVVEHITQLEQQKAFEMGRDLKQPIVRIEKRIRERTVSLRKAEERAVELQVKIDQAKQQLEVAEKELQDAIEKEKECEAVVQSVQTSYAEAQATTTKHKKLLHQEESVLEKLRSKLHETLQRARVEKVELPIRNDDDEDNDEVHESGDVEGGRRATRSSRRDSRGKHGDEEMVVSQASESQSVVASAQTSSRGMTQYSQDDHPIVVRDQEKASKIDFTKLSKTLQRRISDRDEKKIRKDFEDKLQKLTSEIDSITPNMKANDAFIAASQRLKESKNDTEKAKENAIKAAQAFAKVKAKRTKCFMDAYNHIEESLKTIYTDMTKSSKHPLGGNAYLSLDDIEEPYKGGLKFNAMPPMKRFRDMEQLSGGEKTVAALSLLFAIHSYHPAPFFVMDEVDAALDNINLRKVCNYIVQRSRSDFQCIVISLKDMFYEHSDHLIGICRDVNTNSSNTLTLDLTKYDPPTLDHHAAMSTTSSSTGKRNRLSIESVETSNTGIGSSGAPKRRRDMLFRNQ